MIDPQKLKRIADAIPDSPKIEEINEIIFPLSVLTKKIYEEEGAEILINILSPILAAIITNTNLDIDISIGILNKLHKDTANIITTLDKELNHD